METLAGVSIEALIQLDEQLLDILETQFKGTNVLTSRGCLQEFRKLWPLQR